ncbi:MAG: amidohydrolase family protein [Planctomycetes bacterium]|nr:amidohydrolase family protein [Planctomycetota bacterium]
MRSIRGHLLTPTSRGSWREERDAVLHVGADGRIESIGRSAGGGRHLLVPGFVDAHAHVPQHAICGVPAGRLLEWLRRLVFPREARDRGEGAERFFREALRHGTVAGAFYSSAWPESAEACRAAMERLGVRGWIGMPLMDLFTYRPDLARLPLRARTRRVIGELESVLRRDGRVRTAVTPRFALSCSDELLEAAGSFPQPVQTHISEQPDEVSAARRRGRDYLAVYERAGLVRRESIYAHGIWLTASEWTRLRRAGATVAHCPTSNLFLGSGVMDWKAAWKGHVALGTDVGAGPSLSMYDVMRASWASHLAKSGTAPSARMLLEAATVGGACAIGEPLGCLEPGRPATLQVLDRDAILAGEADSLDDLLSRIVHRGGAHAIRAVYVDGKKVKLATASGARYES